MLELVDIELDATAAALIQPVHPPLDLADLLGGGGDRENCVQPRDRHELDALKLGLALRCPTATREEGLQLGYHRLRRGPLEREDPDRLAGEPIDVDRRQRVDDVLPLDPGPREEDQVAAGVDADVLGPAQERLDELGGRGDGEIVQRHDRDAGARRQDRRRGAAERGDLRALRQLVDRRHHIGAVDGGQPGSVHPEHGLEDGQQVMVLQGRAAWTA